MGVHQSFHKINLVGYFYSALQISNFWSVSKWKWIAVSSIKILKNHSYTWENRLNQLHLLLVGVDLISFPSRMSSGTMNPLSFKSCSILLHPSPFWTDKSVSALDYLLYYFFTTLRAVIDIIISIMNGYMDLQTVSAHLSYKKRSVRWQLSSNILPTVTFSNEDKNFTLNMTYEAIYWSYPNGQKAPNTTWTTKCSTKSTGKN